MRRRDARCGRRTADADPERPRFFIHRAIEALAHDIATEHGGPLQRAMLFATMNAARRCLRFVREKAPKSTTLGHLGTVYLGLDHASPLAASLAPINPTISVVLCSAEAFPYAKQYWQHTGDGISSRRAEFCHQLLRDGLLVPAAGPQPSSPPRGPPCRGPRRYQRPVSQDGLPTPAARTGGGGAQETGDRRDAEETIRFVEERFGRNLDLGLLGRARSAIKRRIVGALAADVDIATTPLPAVAAGTNTRGVASLGENDVYLYPCGMNAIYNAHRYLLEARGNLKSINLGFPYVDTLKILEKFGPGCVFYGHASEQDLDALERRLAGGERFLALFCEFPGNPLLTCPNLARIRRLADRYDFAVVVDETIGTFANINVLPFADVVVSSLTKIFSGDCNVMGGSAVFNPGSRYYLDLKAAAQAGFEDMYWAEDVIFMERNSRDFASRVGRINTNAAAISDVLAASPLVRAVFYPKHGGGRANYDACRLPSGGYGGLLSVTFHAKRHAVAFYDAIETAKGPSLGTNFTLTSPYVLLAHYQELDWAASLDVDPDLIRISVGLEETHELENVFAKALAAAGKIRAE